VGIGTTAPQSKLEVRQSSSGAIVNGLKLSNSLGSGAVGTGVALWLDPNGAGSNARSASIQSAQASSGNFADLRFLVSNSATPAEAMRIDSSGNVGIGTSSPATILNAYNATSAIIQLDGDSTTIVRPTRYSTDANPSQFVARKARGTLASPTSVATSDTAGGIFIQAYGGTNFRNIARIDGLVETYTSDTNIAGALRFYTNTSTTDVTEKMRIDSSGNVGIGTTSPSTYGKFAVRGNSVAGTVVSAIVNQSGTADSQVVLSFDPGDNGFNSRDSQIRARNNGGNVTTLEFYTANGTTPAEAMRVTGAGNVGIGTNAPTSGLQTAGSSSKSAFRTPNIAEVNTISATAATGTINYDVTTQSVLYYTTNASGNFTVNFRGSSGTTLNTVMQTGESISATFLVTNGATAYYNSAVQVDGSSVTPKWQGGTAPTSGNASSIDSYTYVIIKTGSAAFTVLASVTKFA
jgi:hypothetical protein